MTDQTTDDRTTDDRTTDDRMEQRVATLLRQAEDFRRHGEDGSADAALALAEKIMLKHSIDAAVIAARAVSGGRHVEIVTHDVNFTGIYRVALAIQFSQLIRAYDASVRSFQIKGRTIQTVKLVGYEDDVKQLSLLITSLQLQALGSLNKWWHNHLDRRPGMEGYKARRQYVASFVRGATERIAQSRQRVVADAAPGTALALRDAGSRVDEYVAEHWDLRTVRTRLKPGSRSADEAGLEAGRRANVGDTSVGPNRREITS